MKLEEVLLHPSEYDGDAVSAPWSWLLPNHASVLHVTVFGNLVLEDEDCRIWLLDSWGGQLHGMSHTYEEYRHSVGSDEEFFRSWFLVALLENLQLAGIRRQPGQVFAPFVSPGMGGSLSPQNFSTAPVVAYAAAAAAESQALKAGTSHRAGA